MLGLLPWAPVKQSALLSKTGTHLCDQQAKLAKQNSDCDWDAASLLFQIYFMLIHISTSAWMFSFEFSFFHCSFGHCFTKTLQQMLSFHHVSSRVILYKAGLLQQSLFPPDMQKGLKHVYALCWTGNIALVTQSELWIAVTIPTLLHHWNSHLILKSLFCSNLCPLLKASLVVLERTVLFLNPLQFSIAHSF